MKDKINELRQELATTEVHATRAVAIAVRLSAYWANINEQLVGAEMTYNRYFEAITHKVTTVSRAKVLSLASKEYETVLELRTLSKSCQEMIRALNRLVRRKELEHRESRY